MSAPCDIILTSSNYFSGKETEPTDDDKKIKWENICDEDHGLIGMSISTDL